MGQTISPAIIIAAGGQGGRMGGSKPLRTLAGRPLIDHAVGWARASSDVVAVAVRDGGQPAGAGLPNLPDRLPGIGPISALDSAFRFGAELGRSHVLLIGCDQPFLPADLASRLADRIGSCGVAMPVSQGRDQPLASLWRVDQPALALYLAEGGRSLWRLADRLNAARIAWPPDPAGDPFANLNDPGSLAEAEARLQARAADA
ncbi:MAG: molybdenum cofactor guanylyltransferase [Sphingomonadaceae bacterium]